MCSNNESISCHFFDTTTFRVYVTACRVPNLEKSVTFGKQLRLKTIDTFPSMYTHSIVNTCHIHWWIGVRKFRNGYSDNQCNSRSSILVPFNRTRDFLLAFHCNYMSILHRFWDINTYFSNFKRPCDLKCTPCCKSLTCLMPVLFTFSLQTKVEMSSFIHSRDMACAPKCRNESCDPDQAQLGDSQASRS